MTKTKPRKLSPRINRLTSKQTDNSYTILFYREGIPVPFATNRYHDDAAIPDRNRRSQSPHGTGFSRFCRQNKKEPVPPTGLAPWYHIDTRHV